MAEKVVGNFRFDTAHELGRGGSGIVYKGVQTNLDNKPVAIKVLHRNLSGSYSEEDEMRFEREIKTLANLNDPRIVQIVDRGRDEAGGYLWYAMEYVSVRTLDVVIQEDELTQADIVAIATGIIKALKSAYGAGIIHRDIKPSNIFVYADKEVKLADFGLARAPGAASLTDSDTIVGTLDYISPERIKGIAEDFRSDIYSFGSVLYEMLAKSPPFGNNLSVPELLNNHLNEPPPPLKDAVPDIHPVLDRLVTRCLSKDPADRPQSYDEILSTLDRVRLALEGAAAVQPAGGLRKTALIGFVTAACASAVIAFSLLAGGGDETTSAVVENNAGVVADTPTNNSSAAIKPDKRPAETLAGLMAAFDKEDMFAALRECAACLEQAGEMLIATMTPALVSIEKPMPPAEVGAKSADKEPDKTAPTTELSMNLDFYDDDPATKGMPFVNVCLASGVYTLVESGAAAREVRLEGPARKELCKGYFILFNTGARAKNGVFCGYRNLQELGYLPHIGRMTPYLAVVDERGLGRIQIKYAGRNAKITSLSAVYDGRKKKVAEAIRISGLDGDSDPLIEAGSGVRFSLGEIVDCSIKTSLVPEGVVVTGKPVWLHIYNVDRFCELMRMSRYSFDGFNVFRIACVNALFPEYIKFKETKDTIIVEGTVGSSSQDVKVTVSAE